MKIGLLGGTFDPFHLGHLGFAIQLREICGFDEVWIVPATRSPLKADDAASADHRRRMVELGIEGVEGLRLEDVDLTRPGLSYTVDTLRILSDRFPAHRFSLCLSDDLASRLKEWRHYDQILAQVPLVVGRRLLQGIPAVGDRLVDEALAKGYIETSIVQIEATQIRDRLRRGLTCAHLLPAPVLAYIQKHQLYGRIDAFEWE